MAKRRMVVEWGSERYSNVVDAHLNESAKSGQGIPATDYLLTNLKHFGQKMRDYARHNNERFGPVLKTQLVKADFLKTPVAANFADELHAHLVFSAHKLNSRGEEETTFRRSGGIIKPVTKRYVDVRANPEKPDFSEAKKMFSEASRILKKGGKFMVSESEEYFPLREIEGIAKSHGFKKIRVSRDFEEMGQYSSAMAAIRNDPKLGKKAYLIEFEKM